MNQRTRLEREIVRKRRRYPRRQLTRVTTPSGQRVQVEIMPRGRSSYYHQWGGWIFAKYPPTPEVYKTISRWQRRKD